MTLKAPHMLNRRQAVLKTLSMGAFAMPLMMFASMAMQMGNQPSAPSMPAPPAPPPPPPTDFDIRWDYRKNELKLNWCFPVNTQQDIKIRVRRWIY